MGSDSAENWCICCGLGIGLWFCPLMICAIMFGVSVGPPRIVETDCFAGNSLNPSEQMWCSPNLTTNVKVNMSANCLSLYRVKKADLSKKIIRHEEVRKSLTIPSNTFDLYPFVMMAGSNVTAYIESNTSSDHCYLLNETNYVKFMMHRHGNNFTCIDEGIGILNTSFSATSNDAYYFVIEHHDNERAKVTLNMNFSYLVYDVSSKRAAKCSKKEECEFEDIAPDEMIIADNHGNKKCESRLVMVEERDFASMWIPSLVVMVVSIIMEIVSFVLFWYFKWLDEKRTCCDYYALNKISDYSVYILFFAGLVFIIPFLVFLILFAVFVNDTTVEEEFCFNRTFLNPSEQMLCSPNSTIDVKANMTSNCISLYRVNKSDLPDKIFRHSAIYKSMNIPSHRYASYSFLMMEGSSVTASIESDTSSDYCYLLDDENFKKFGEFSSFTYIDRGIGALNTSFKATKNGLYYFLIDHPEAGKTKVALNMSFFYSVYDVSRKKAADCSAKDECLFEDTTPDELIIADNHGKTECNSELLLSEEHRTDLWIVFLCLTIGFLLLIGSCFVISRLCRYWNNVLDERRHGPRKPWKKIEETTPLTSTSDSTTPTTAGSTLGSETSSTISYVNELPPYSA